MKKKKPTSKPEENYPVDEELPEGWKSVVLEDHIYIAARIGWRGLKREEYTKEGPLFLAVKDIQENGFIDFQNVTDHLSEYRYDESPEIQLKEEDIIITKDGTIGKIGFVKDLPGKVTVNSSLLVVRPSSEILPRFLFFYFRSADFQKIVRERITGSAVPHLFQKDIKKFRILVPPLAEQQRIVARVEALLSHVNAARERVSRVPLIMKKFRQAVLSAACTGKLTEGWREENLDVESGSQLLERIAGKASHSTVPYDDDPPLSLPEIPESWEWSRCFPLSDPKRDITYGVIKLGVPIKGGIPTLRSSDVRWLHIDNSDVKTINPDIASQYSRTFLKGGEIVITVRGSLGGIAVVPQSMAGYNISREVAVLPLLSGLDAKYFSYAIASIWSQNWLSEVTKGVAYTGINIRDLKRLPLPLPPLAEQHEIVRRVGLLFERADVIDREVEAAGRRCERLTQAVLARAFSGKL